jgi:hypothetical protein
MKMLFDEEGRAGDSPCDFMFDEALELWKTAASLVGEVAVRIYYCWSIYQKKTPDNKIQPVRLTTI